MAAHTCHADGCTTPVPPRMFMCRVHWFALPKSYQDAIWASYRPGQERDKDPSDAYLAAAMAAVNYLKDPVTEARKTAAWQRDVPRDCRCPHTWNWDTDKWERREGASCGKHPS